MSLPSSSPEVVPNNSAAAQIAAGAESVLMPDTEPDPEQRRALEHAAWGAIIDRLLAFDELPELVFTSTERSPDQDVLRVHITKLDELKKPNFFIGKSHEPVGRIIKRFAGTAPSSREALDAISILFSSECKRYHDTRSHMGSSESSLGVQSAHLMQALVPKVVSTEEGADAFRDFITDQLLNKKSTLAQELVKKFEIAIRTVLPKLAQTNPEAAGRIANIYRFLDEFNNPPLTQGPRDPNSMLYYTSLMVFPELAELRLEKMVQTSSVAQSAAEQEQSTRAARDILRLLLERYASDPNRHGSNVVIASRHLFPDERRNHTLSRRNLINLANAVRELEAKQSGESARRLPDERGQIELAVADVLRITRIGATGEHLAKMERDDLIYTQLIGMLLEQRQATEGSQPTSA
jgi:hypothetical protein